MNQTARVLLGLKILPSDVSVNLDLLKKKIQENFPKYVETHRSGIEPIAFGLSALIMYVSIPEEKSGGMVEVEKSIHRVEEVSQMDVILTHRM